MPVTAPSAFARARLLHTMIRVQDLERSLAFYTGLLGMRLVRRMEFPDGQFSLAFVGYGPEADTAVIELTHNWDGRGYVHGSAFGHIAVGVADLDAACAALSAAGVDIPRAPGPLAGNPDEWIAFARDPDGYLVELIQTPGSPPAEPLRPDVTSAGETARVREGARSLGCDQRTFPDTGRT